MEGLIINLSPITLPIEGLDGYSGLSMHVKKAWTGELVPQYRKANNKEKSHTLDRFVR
ncbi:MAG: hypothetical protein LBB80_01970 [Treponema sp.]|jgi:hypothetical protein|nr:hypothetical protein [Treponema sp.]